MKPTIGQVREAVLWGTIGGCCETCDKYRALAAALDGYALVPVEPTEAMLRAFNEYALCTGYVPEGYRAMLKEAE